MQIDMEYIRAQLTRRRDERQLSAVARGSGVSFRTLINVVNGYSNLRTGTATTLQEFLKATHRMAKIPGQRKKKAKP